MGSKMNGFSAFKTFRTVNCVSCNNNFHIKDFSFRGSRCPILLHCGHSMCEFCIQHIMKVRKSISCPQCGVVSPLLSSNSINECFPYNVYMIGSLVTLQNYKFSRENRLAILAKADEILTYTIKGQGNKVTVACEECSGTASWFCENCTSNFCESCWSKIHISAKSLRKHSKIPLSNDKVKNNVKKCSQHESQFLEFYCKGCSITVCSHCVILQHQGDDHAPITLKEKNIEMKNLVMSAAEEGDKIEKRMKQTYEKAKISNEYPDTYDHKNYAEMESQITKNFSRLHGLLQLEEERLLKKLQKNFHERGNCIKNILDQLEKQIEHIDSMMSEYRWAMRNPHSTDYIDLHQRLLKLQDLPCYLIAKSDGNTQPRVEFDSSIIDMIESFCRLELPSGELYDLRAESNLPEGYAVEPLVVLDPEQKQDFSECETLSSDSRSISEPSTSKEFKPKTFTEKRNYSVRMAYIKSPGEFYVHLLSQKLWQDDINEKALRIASSSSEIPNKIAKDHIYLAQYKVDEEWYRGRVVEVSRNRKINGEDCVQIYYIDYGNTDIIPVSKLRSLPPDMLEIPPLAVKCKLFDCVPKDGAEWSPESTKTMEKILKEYIASMYVMKIHRDCLEVDLSVIYPEGMIGRDIVSVRDALMFLEFASFVRGSKIPRNATIVTYMNQLIPAVGEIFDAFITHVNSASDFYLVRVQTRDDTNFLFKLSMDLQGYYDDDLDKNIVYNPSVGMPCVARFSEDNKWYRAKITDVPGDKKVTVFYVDYGNSETIPWTSIRKLRENFVKRPPLALSCSLAGIFPYGSFWNSETKSYLQKLIMTKNCRVHVHSRPKNKTKLKVLLYKQVSKKEICVNNLFVDMGHAVRSGPQNLRMLRSEEQENDEVETTSETVKTQEVESVGDVEVEPLTLDTERKNVLIKNENNFRRLKRTKLRAKELIEMHESKKKTIKEEEQTPKPVENEFDEYDNIFKVKVEILSSETPSAIYVTFPALMEEFNQLLLQMNEFYQNSTLKSDQEWTEGNICAAFDSSKGFWYRAAIQAIFPDGQVKVFMKDVAEVKTIPLSSLRVLDPKFTKIATCSIKCHLADIAPPGAQWPTVSSEYLTSELERYSEVYMTKKGQIDNRSLPVELWVQRIVARGALEPTTKEWITMNRLLVHQGLAVPTRPKIWEADLSVKQECSDDERDLMASVEVLCSDQVENVVSCAFVPSTSCRWMPPEPLKESRFFGVATYVDHNAVIYAYDLEQDNKTLQSIRSTLFKEFEDTKPSPEDHFWSVGQLCIAKYHVDNAWYRGQILEVNENNSYEVLFVDYGNVETCKAPDLRKKIKMLDTPILSHKFKLQGVVPASEDGVWSTPVIDFLHSLVVDKKNEIVVLRHPLDPNEPHIATLRLLQENVDVGTYLINQGVAALSFGDSDNSEPDDLKTKEEILCESEVSRYVPLKIPDLSMSFFIEVTHIENETEFNATIVYDDSLSPSLKKILKDFKELQRSIAAEGPKQPLLKNIKKGVPCCCICSKTNVWCRGEVVNYTEKQNLVCVLYVDYGGKGVHLQDKVYEIYKDWLKVPKMALKCKLGHVVRCSGASKASYLKALTTCLNANPFLAEILRVSQDVLEVRLLNKRNGEFAYQSMIDMKLMTCFKKN